MYFKRIDLQGCWEDRVFTGKELVEWCNDDLYQNDNYEYKIKNIPQAIEYMNCLEFDIQKINKNEYLELTPIY